MVKLKLTKPELRALRYICNHEGSASQLADSMGVKRSFFTRITRSLEDNGLIQKTKLGTQKIVSLSTSNHAQTFKQLSDSKPDMKIENWLSGYAISILVTALKENTAVEESTTVEQILDETGCSSLTLYKWLNLMQNAGVLLWKEGRVSVVEQLLKKFVSEYADNLQYLIQQQAKGLNTSIRIRKHVVLRTDAKEVPIFFTRTGISALAEKGLEATLTSYGDYYFDLDQNKVELSVEECFTHAILMASLKQHQDMPVLSIFFAKNYRKLDMRKLQNFAKVYAVEGALDEIRGKTEFHEKMQDEDMTTKTPGAHNPRHS